LAGITSFTARWKQSDTEAFAMGLDRCARRSEWGLDAVWLAEIHQQASRSVMSAPLTVLAALAAATSRVKLGTGVQVLPLTHPLRLAEETATVDQISRGRLLMGVGRSGNPRAYAAYGVPYSESRERFFETLDVLKLAWTRRFSFHGKFHHFDHARAVPRPLQHAASADPHRRRVGGYVSGVGRSGLSAVRRGAQRVTGRACARSACAIARLMWRPVIKGRARCICG
jgi:alkanesulfonate monooxygenase SsuD/methylene tetrahydromethanopterin reductase-like flavin-dependent oxidoreductase (luciferase family)